MQKTWTRPSRFSSTPILSDTLAPPRTATKGCAGATRRCCRISTSRRRRNPAALLRKKRAMPAVEAWGRGAAPQASATQTAAELEDVANRRRGGVDAGRVRDAAGREGDVQVRADEDALRRELELLDQPHPPPPPSGGSGPPGARRRASGTRSPTRCRTRRGPCRTCGPRPA